MSERLSDDDLRDILSDDDAWVTRGEIQEMARELLALRSRVVELDAAASNAIGEALTLRAKLSEWPWSLDAGLSWSGFGISGDTRSIAEVKRLISVEGMADVLQKVVIEQRAQLASGPMMPETPSEAVIVAAFTYAGIPDDANDDEYRADFKGLWSAIRSALMQGQGRG